VWFKTIVEERGQIEIEAVNWSIGTDAVSDGASVKVDIASENVDDLFEATGRKLNDGLHKIWWRDRVKDSPADRERAKLELFALGSQPEVMTRVEDASQELVQKWLKAHVAAIGNLSEDRRALYDEIKYLAASPELTPLVHPAVVQVRQGKLVWKKHLYVDDNGKYHADFYDSESEVLDREISNRKVVGWLRNTDRKPWALCVPFEFRGEMRPMYPDFLIVRSERSGLVVDIIEPHAITFADAPAKAAGLAKFAAQHFDKFGRIILILIDGKAQKHLNLADETTRNRIRAVTLPEQLRQLFSDK
jgi:type III restriction enzyme